MHIHLWCLSFMYVHMYAISCMCVCISGIKQNYSILWRPPGQLLLKKQNKTTKIVLTKLFVCLLWMHMQHTTAAHSLTINNERIPKYILFICSLTLYTSYILPSLLSYIFLNCQKKRNHQTKLWIISILMFPEMHMQP